MQANQVDDLLRIQKYKQFYQSNAQKISGEEVIQLIAELKLLQSDFQLQKDEYHQSKQKVSKQSKKIQKLDSKNQELQQQLCHCQTLLKSAISQRDTAIGEKYIIQKKYESLQSTQDLQTEPSNIKQVYCLQEVRTEANGVDSIDQLNPQIQDLEQKLVQVKMENSQVKQKLEDCQFELKEYQKVIQSQAKIMKELKNELELQKKSVSSTLNEKNLNIQVPPQENSKNQQNQEQQIKQLIRTAQTTSYNSLPTLKNVAQLNQHILEKQMINQIKFQEILEQSEEIQSDVNYSLTSREKITHQETDFSDMIFNVLSINNSNSQISKQRIQNLFGLNVPKVKESKRWF